MEAALDSRAMVAALKPAEITVCSSVRLKMAEETPARFACFPGAGMSLCMMLIYCMTNCVIDK